MHRLFVAIRPPVTIRDHLITIMRGVSGARWQDDDQLHLTLRYIGEVDCRTADDAADALSGVCAPGFEIALAGLGQFERRGRIDTLWAGVTPHAPLAALHRKIDAALVRTGLAPEGRAYLPHITLARFSKRGGDASTFLAAHGGLATAPFAVTHFALFESELSKAGSRYTLIERWRL